MVCTTLLTFETHGGFDVRNITNDIAAYLHTTGIQSGLLVILYRHTTGAVFLAEHEAGIVVDLEEVLEELVPQARSYKHHLRQVDTNGHAHVRSALMSTSLTLPVHEGELMLGTYQDILLLDMQEENKPREVVLLVIGEG